ncbi:MAG: hypothetical protein SNJ81_16520, partial [Cyanobacteriota bacterium]
IFSSCHYGSAHTKAIRKQAFPTNHITDNTTDKQIRLTDNSCKLYPLVVVLQGLNDGLACGVSTWLSTQHSTQRQYATGEG